MYYDRDGYYPMPSQYSSNHSVLSLPMPRNRCRWKYIARARVLINICHAFHLVTVRMPCMLHTERSPAWRFQRRAPAEEGTRRAPENAREVKHNRLE